MIAPGQIWILEDVGYAGEPDPPGAPTWCCTCLLTQPLDDRWMGVVLDDRDGDVVGHETCIETEDQLRASVLNGRIHEESAFRWRRLL